MFYSEKTNSIEITNDADYEESSALLKALQTQPYVPDHPVLAHWQKAKAIDSIRLSLHVAIEFVPLLMQAMINYLEKN
jgi:hypothetical protein